MKYWTDGWNPIVGCAPISVGCDNCYAAACASQRKMKKYERVLLNSKWTGEVHLDRAALEAPLHARKPRVYFNSMCDPFHKLVPDEWLDEMFEIMRVSNQHTFVICTKRAQRMAEYVNGFAKWDKFQNLYLGVTVENQQCADERLPHLAKLAAAGWNTWISYEPALGPVDWKRAFTVDCGSIGGEQCQYALANFKGIIAGGESGPNARPAHPDWFRSCRDVCAEADIKFTFKQWGEWLPDNQLDMSTFVIKPGHPGAPKEFIDLPICNLDYGLHVIKTGSKRAGRLLDGIEHWQLPWEVTRPVCGQKVEVKE